MSYLSTLGRALAGRSTKASGVGNLIARLMLGMPVWPRRDFEKLAREGYQQNPIVARGVGLIADSVASIVMELHKGRGKSRTVIEDHPLLELLSRPNPEQDGAAFIQAVVSHLVITGNTFLERTNEDKLERMELYALRPDRTRVVPAANGFAMGYEYTASGATRRFEIDVDRGVRPILHLKRFHPIDDFYGMSPLDPAAFSIDTHNASGAFNKALLDNSATPAGAFVYSGNPTNGNAMADDQYARLKEMLDDQMTGTRNAGRPMILEGGLDWKTMSIDPDKMQFVEAKNMAAREIALALGVPPMLLGIPGDNTYANYAEANRAFYRQTVVPLAKWLARALTHWFADHLERDMRLEIDLDTIEGLRSERMELWSQVDKTTFLTINEKRELLGWQPVEGGDDVYVGSGMLPIGIDATVAGGAAPVADDEQGAGRGAAAGKPPQKPKLVGAA
jgi:HK97 family phage portal protein